MSKQPDRVKVLIITYYWPPAGGPGVQRWLKFVKYLPQYNIEPVVYIPENPEYALLDKTLTSEVPKGVTILEKAIWEPYKYASLFSNKETKTISKGIIEKKAKQSSIQQLLLFIRGNFFIPDARKFWIKPSVKYLKQVLTDQEINTIITTGPPHSVHLIGNQLKKQLGIRWIADFRDPWTSIGYHSKLKLLPFAQKKHKRLEKEVLNSADHIITTSFTTTQDFQELTQKPVTTITNGFDAEKVEGEVFLDKKFTISHIGSLLADRNPTNLWKVLSTLVKSHKDFASFFELKLAGAVSEEVLSSIEEAGLKEYTTNLGYVSHTKAVQLQQSSQLLLLIEIDHKDCKGIIAGKLFEYLKAKRPILALGPVNSDVEKIIKETESGYYFTYNTTETLQNQLLTYYKHYKNKELQSASKNILKYHRKNLTGSLAEVIKSF
ncbi:glycosyl transferase family 1 [Aquimarina sp. ERC-38]|uniref:glycosyl transferase family 1 n=1 Tax=Aquimarina sp. ERC-38 TaxID=2949996 RepID=UPI00224664D0|nr:glycosyl transferase family 1 [Aquimarina sp. ERC-38]UZO79632.1 glycosyl transferase family 1 [Aquimarina sp. ERC-38]